MNSLVGVWSKIIAARNVLIAIAATAALCLPLAYCEGSKKEKARCAASRALANAKALEMDAHAGARAAEDRVADALAVAEKEKGLLDAIATVDDTRPDRVRVALGCQRLRGQGTGEADLPAICRP